MTCLACKHYQLGAKCPAYPNRIPISIISGERSHRTILPDQESAIAFEYGPNKVNGGMLEEPDDYGRDYPLLPGFTPTLGLLSRAKGKGKKKEAKKCQKGQVCGLSCIAKTKTCIADMTLAQLMEHNRAKRAEKKVTNQTKANGGVTPEQLEYLHSANGFWAGTKQQIVDRLKTGDYGVFGDRLIKATDKPFPNPLKIDPEEGEDTFRKNAYARNKELESKIASISPKNGTLTIPIAETQWVDTPGSLIKRSKSVITGTEDAKGKDYGNGVWVLRRTMKDGKKGSYIFHEGTGLTMGVSSAVTIKEVDKAARLLSARGDNIGNASPSKALQAAEEVNIFMLYSSINREP